MTIDEAIKILKDGVPALLISYTDDFIDAVKLGIEGLEFLEKIPILPIRPGRELLPGETEE